MSRLSHYAKFAILFCWIVILAVMSYGAAVAGCWSLSSLALVAAILLATQAPQSWHLARKSAARAASKEL